MHNLQSHSKICTCVANQQSAVCNLNVRMCDVLTPWTAATTEHWRWPSWPKVMFKTSAGKSHRCPARRVLKVATDKPVATLNRFERQCCGMSFANFLHVPPCKRAAVATSRTALHCDCSIRTCRFFNLPWCMALDTNRLSCCPPHRPFLPQRCRGQGRALPRNID